MCGIAGFFFDDRGRSVDEAPLRAMIDAIHHRGPDGAGFHVEPSVGFGHARLSIIDLAGGAQPLANADDTIWITYNGEVFNYLELREWLASRGHVFKTHSDTEVIVHMYEELGDKFVEQLNGQFAFAIWDRRKRRLLLVRDRTGILPLYYAQIPGGIVFASEVKALLASKWVQPQLDPVGLDELFTFWAPVAPRTVFRNVLQLPPGQMLVVSEGKQQTHQYWSWEFPTRGELRRAPESTLRTELRTALSDATQLRLRADVPVGAYLSGGLDSSALVALLKEKVPDTLHTFSIGFDDANLDESGYQQQVAAWLKTQHHHIQCSHLDIARSFPMAIRHAESPVLRTAPAPMRLLSGSVRQAGIKVVLTGEGADEVFGGYDIFKEAKVRQFWARNPNSAWRPALLKRLYPYLDLTSAQSTAYLREFFGVGLDNPDDPCFTHLPRWATTAQCKLFFSEDWRAQVQESAVERFRASLPAAVTTWHTFNRGEYVEAQTLLPSYLLSFQGDRMLMASSIEGRFPFLDHHVIEFANRLHPSYKMRVLREKHLLKDTMAPSLPPEIVNRHKQPYRAPDAAAFLGDNAPDYVNELLGPTHVNRYGYFEADKVSRLVAKLRRARVSAPRDNMAFVGILSTQLWHSIFVEGRSDF
ncbi:MAG: asparagine synthase (glutamine-hydrolyzing) [Candidatus Obscuribacterales bacterium]|nr:asparagine synthase (glutamine-hydrolyzing) [Steroidobacteraceae bacterium]